MTQYNHKTCQQCLKVRAECEVGGGLFCYECVEALGLDIYGDDD